MKKWISLGLLCLTGQALANLHLAPPDFDIKSNRAVFVDFKKAHYEITFDQYRRKATVKTRIEFEQTKAGMPLFDLVPAINSANINGENVKVASIRLPNSSQARLIEKNLAPGNYVVEMSNAFKENVEFMDDYRFVKAAFWIRDLKDRLFMEQYIPSNFEFDQYQMTFDVKFVGTELENQDIYTNGVMKKVAKNHYRIDFPSYFTVSCPYFHVTGKNSGIKRADFTYKSISGRNIPMTVYSPWSSRTKKFKAEAIRVMQELEADYGPWAHPTFVAYGTLPGLGGMEHSGATVTSFAALDHEMLHSYFAKGVMPANGNSGWIDEAIASWRDNGYQRLMTPGFTGSNIGAQSVYKRNTDDRSYKLGSAFMAYLDYRLQDMGGLKAFLRGYFAAFKHTVVTTEHFKNNLEFWSGINFDEDFNRYILNNDIVQPPKALEQNPYHPEMSAKDLRSIL